MLKVIVDIFLGAMSGSLYAIGLLFAKKSDTKQTPIKSAITNAVRFFLCTILIVLLLRSLVTFPMLYMICFFSGYWIIIYRYGVS